MNWLGRLFRKRKLEAQLDSELRFHLEQRAADLIATGVEPTEARRRAMLEFGGTESAKEKCREARGTYFLETLVADIRYAWRMLRKSPGFTIVAVLTLALGIGANTAIFSLIDALVLRPLPVPHPQRLVRFGVRNSGNVDKFAVFLSVPMFREFSLSQKVFASTFARWGPLDMATNANGMLLSTGVLAVTGEYFSGWGMKPELGRLIAPEDVDLKTEVPRQVVVLSYKFWREQYGGLRNVVGRTLKIEGEPFTIIGVSQRMGSNGARLGRGVAIPLTALPLVASNDNGTGRHLDREWVSAEGRLRRGATLTRARAQLESLWPGVREDAIPAGVLPAVRAEYEAMQLRVESGEHGEGYLASVFARPLYILLELSATVLMLACLNLASLMLARAASRDHEMGVRAALGADGWRLVRQTLTESVMLSLVGAGIALPLAFWTSHVVAGFAFSGIRSVDLSPDWRVLAFTAAAALLTGATFGLAPAWRAGRADVCAALKEGIRTLGRGSGRLARVLIVTQLALSLVLVACAGLFLRSLEKLRQVQPGFETQGLLDIGLAPAPDGYKNLDWVSYRRNLIRRVSTLPGVTSAGIGGLIMGNGYVWSQRLEPEGSAVPTPPIDCEVVTPGFFRTLGITLLRGRTFTWGDNSRSPLVAIVTASLARRLFPRRDPVGRHLELPNLPKKWSPVEIVGIVSDAHLFDIRRKDLSVLYFPKLQHRALENGGDLYVRASRTPQGLGDTIRSAVTSLGHEYVDSLSAVSGEIDQSLLRDRVMALLAAFFGGLALLLAAIGLYGLMAYSVAGRRREIGIRLALGAQSVAIGKMVMGEAGRLLLLGAAIGVTCALATLHFVANMLFHLSPYDPAILALALIVLVAVGTVAAYLPVRGAMRVDPAVALRQE